MIIPWPIVSLMGFVAEIFGYGTYVRAIGGPGWHWGRVGAERVYFHKRPPGEKPVKRLKPSR
jgi:hypothetical protein